MGPLFVLGFLVLLYASFEVLRSWQKKRMKDHYMPSEPRYEKVSGNVLIMNTKVRRDGKN